MGRRYRLAPVPAIALAVAVPIVVDALLFLVDVPIRRDLSLLLGVAIVLILAWAGGIWAGLTGTAVIAILFATGPLSARLVPPLDGLSLFLFLVSGMTGSAVAESLYRARWRVESARDRARKSRRAEHDARAELESIVAAIGDGIVVADADGSISLMNRAAIDFMGGRLTTLDQLFEDFAPDDTGKGPAERLRGDERITAEFELKAGNRRIELSSSPLSSENAARRVLVLRDVTVTRRREMLRDAFLSLLSHELRTPMTAVYGGATLMQRVGDRLDSKTRNEIRADIVHEADRLARLIDDLLVLARMEEGVEVGQEPTLLQHLVQRVVDQDYPPGRGTVVQVVAEPGLPPVRGDETGIQQVTHNLISNAVKYSPKGSEVEVRIESSDHEVAVRVLDRGAGLSVEEAAHVFEPFYRGQATHQLAGGVGIGLYVCQRLVQAMDGRIWTRPREEGGSEFGFALPLWPIEPDDVAPSPAGTDLSR